MTDLVRRTVFSYRQLPCNLYHIQTKFRDEIRPRFGLMRAREFIMKDGYSFHLDEPSFERAYAAMHECYSRILERMGLRFRAVEADAGTIGDGESHEFHVLADSGEDTLVYSPVSDYAANLDTVPVPTLPDEPEAAGAEQQAMRKVPTPNAGTIDAVATLLDVPAARCVKTLIVYAEEGGLAALVLRGDHQLNEAKASRLAGIRRPFGFADEAQVRAELGVGVGSIGPVGLGLPLVVDGSAAALAHFVCGANEGRPSLHRCSLGARCGRGAGRGHPQRGAGRRRPGRQWPAGVHARHRGGPHLQAWHEIHASDGCRRAGRGRQGRRAAHGLLRVRHFTHGGRGRGAEPRRRRHRLAASGGAVRRSPRRAQQRPIVGGESNRGDFARGAGSGRPRNAAGRPR